MRVDRFMIAMLMIGVGAHPAAGFAEAPSGARALEMLRAVEVAREDADSPAGLASNEAGAHLAYASVLFYKGQSLLRFGKREDGQEFFRQVVEELSAAVELSSEDADVAGRDVVRSQCAYLLGDVFLHVYDDVATAKAFYEQALRYFPAHSAAEIALKVTQ